MNTQQRLAQLEKKLLEVQARNAFQAMGGDVSHWDGGLKNSLLPQMELTLDGDLNQVKFDAAIASFPGIERHMTTEAQPQQQQDGAALPSDASPNMVWEAVNQARAASPRR